VKLQPDPKQSLNTVTRYDAAFIEINEICFKNSVLVMPQGDVEAWSPQRFEDLAQADFKLILEKKPALVIPRPSTDLPNTSASSPSPTSLR